MVELIVKKSKKKFKKQLESVCVGLVSQLFFVMVSDKRDF